LDIDKTLENPFFIWERPFHTELRRESQILLLLILFSNDSLNETELNAAFIDYTEKLPKNLNTSTHFIKQCVKEITGTFIIVKNKVYQFLNPSVRDFLLKHVTEDVNETIDLIKGMLYLDYLLFAFIPYHHQQSITGAIPLNEQLSVKLENRIVVDFHYLNISKSNLKKGDVILQKLDMICKRFDLKKYSNIREIVQKQVEQIDPSNLIDDDKLIYMSTLNILRPYLKIDFHALFNMFSQQVTDIRGLLIFAYFQKILEKDFERFMNDNEEFYWSIYDIVKTSKFQGSWRELALAKLRIEIVYGTFYIDGPGGGNVFIMDDEKEVIPVFDYNKLNQNELANMRSVFHTLFQKFEHTASEILYQ
jgi:hypothetical protein